MSTDINCNPGKTVSFSHNSVNVFFHILTDCNLSCTHCYINPEQHGANRLPLKTAIKWLDHFKNSASKANLVILGGEPTMHKGLPEIISHGKKMGFASITIDTNGYLFHDILDKISPAQVNFISFSLDGPDAQSNDAIRGKGSFDKCVSGIKQAKSKGFSTSLIYTVSSANIQRLDEMVSFIDTLGIQRFFIQVIGIRGKSAEENESNLQVTKEAWLNIVPKAAEKAAQNGMTVTFPKVFLEHDETFECAGIKADNYFIFPNGRVYRCPLCEDYPIHSLEISEEGLTKAPKINESDLFNLNIPEGCVMNRLVQPDNIVLDENGNPKHKIACCLLKQEIAPQ